MFWRKAIIESYDNAIVSWELILGGMSLEGLLLIAPV